MMLTMVKQPEPTWLICVWKFDGLPTVIQIDMVGADGTTQGSTSPAQLIKEGYVLPDFSNLREGNYRFSDLSK